MTRKRIGLMVVVCVGLAGVVLLHHRSGEQSRAERVESQRWTVARMDRDRVLRERGWVVSDQSVPVEARAGGDLLELLETGTRVEAGDVILRIDDREIRESIEEHMTGLEARRLSIEVATAKREMTKANLEGMLALWKRRLEYAQLAFRTAEAGLDPLSRRLLEIDVELAELAVADAREELARQERLLAKAFVSASMVEPFQRRLTVAEANLEEKRLQLSLKDAGPPQEELLELERQVERYAAHVARGSLALERALEAIDAEIAAHHAREARNLEELGRAQAELSNCVVRASVAGVVRVRDFRDHSSGWAWMPYRAGQNVDVGDRIADIVNLGKMAVEFMVHEADINCLREGMEAWVSLPSIPGRRFRGMLEAIGGVGRDRSDVAPEGYEATASGVTMFNGRVRLDPTEIELRPGMSAILSFPLDSAEEVFLVPHEYLAVDGAGERGVWIDRGGTDAHWQPVEAERFDARFSRVVRGVEAGDRLIARETDGGSHD